MWTVRQNQFKWQDFSFMNRGGGWFWIFWFKLWKDNVRDCGGRREAQREEAGPSCLALSNDLCIMKDGNNISHSLQGSTLWQDLHIHTFFPSPPLPFYTANYFSCEQDICLPDTALEEGNFINMCRETYDLSRCRWKYGNMERCQHRHSPRYSALQGLRTRKLWSRSKGKSMAPKKKEIYDKRKKCLSFLH